MKQDISNFVSKLFVASHIWEGGATDDKTTNRRFGHHVIDTHTE